MNSLQRLAQAPRRINLAGALLCFGLVAVAVALEVWQGLEPCPLCIFQRVAFLFMGAALLIGALMPGLIAMTGVALGALAGIGLAARHLWLQSLPADQVPACGPGLDYLLDSMPLNRVLSQVLAGSGECAEVDVVLGLSIPLWTLIAFVLIGGVFTVVNGMARQTRPA